MGNNRHLQGKLNSILQRSDIPWWEWNIRDNIVTFNDLKVTMLGYKIEDFKNVPYQEFTALIHPEDYERSMDAMRDYLYGRAEIYQTDYRIKDVNGNYKWYLDRGAAIEKDESGKPIILRGIVLNMGEYMKEELYIETVMKLLRESGTALNRMKSGIITICSNCMKNQITPEKWVKLDESFIEDSATDVSHTVCPDCIRLLYPEISKRVLKI
ncbi:MAG: PAS domain-containing protein [bacterium]